MRTKTVLVGMVVLCAAAATAFAGLSKLRGQILLSDQPLPVLDDEDKWVDALKKASKTTLEKPKGADGWSFHVMAFLDRKPNTTSINLMFYDVTDGKREYVTSKSIGLADANATIVATEIEVTVEDGVKPGRKFELTVAVINNDKATDLAKTKVTFTEAK